MHHHRRMYLPYINNKNCALVSYQPARGDIDDSPNAPRTRHWKRECLVPRRRMWPGADATNVTIFPRDLLGSLSGASALRFRELGILNHKASDPGNASRLDSVNQIFLREILDPAAILQRNYSIPRLPGKVCERPTVVVIAIYTVSRSSE